LMRNAIEASPPNGVVLIAVTPSKGALRVRIENAGPAIPARVASQIFEPFFTAKEGGTGLGLAIARSIVDRHQGELQLERNDTDHIAFTITFPSIIEKDTAQTHAVRES
jgi:signal transduction histidine kinase